MRTYTCPATIPAAILAMLLATIGFAQSRPSLESYGAFDEANRVANTINSSNAGGCANAIPERTPNSLIGNFGVSACRVAPIQNDRKVDDPKQRGPNVNPDLTITITWNTSSDVDLCVTEPDGRRCTYKSPETKNGGKLHEDNTTGFGPETYSIAKAPQGEFVIGVHHFRAVGPTTVQIEVIRHIGTPQQITQRHTVYLQSNGQTIEVCRLRF